MFPPCRLHLPSVSCGERRHWSLSLFQHKQGKVGPDGKELIPQESPRVGGFGFVATPSPAPGKKRAVSPGWTGQVQARLSRHALRCPRVPGLVLVSL